MNLYYELEYFTLTITNITFMDTFSYNFYAVFESNINAVNVISIILLICMYVRVCRMYLYMYMYTLIHTYIYAFGVYVYISYRII